jgi:YD repeat-containing protein
MNLGSYTSQGFGGNWKSNFEERLFTVYSGGSLTYARGDGSFWIFTPIGSNQWSLSSPANETVSLTSGTDYWTLKFLNGETRQFSNTDGSLTAIIDRNGNTTTLTYSSGRLTTVTDPASRHLYFTYASSTSSLITAVTSDVGLSLSYAYDSQGRLTLVTNPDGSTLAFEYGASNAFWITAVKDSQGKVLEAHTYDGNGRGLSGTRANGVDALTLSFSN